MANLFISYSRKDKEVAQKLAEALKGQELDLWIDWEDIEPTIDWRREIEKGIEGADNFLFLLSPDSAGSQVCRQEIEHAVKNGKRLIPVIVRDIQADESPAQLRPLNWIFLRETDDFQTAFGELITAVKTDYAWVEFHRNLQVRALEWERDHHENSLLLRGKDLQDTESELATNSSKEPHPTDLQREYVHRSRQASDRQRRLLLSASFGATIVMAGLAFFGFVQAKLATDRANIALARQLAAQAQTINATRNSKQMTAVLLAAQSMKLLPSTEAAQILLNSFGARLITRINDAGGLSSVAFSPDSRYIVSGSYDNGGGARVWEAATGKEIAHITSGSITRVAAFSPDGKYVASAACDRSDADLCTRATARVWEAATGREVAHISQDGDVGSIAFSPDGKYAVSGSYDGTARVWEAMTGREIARMTHDNAVLAVAFSPDGKYVASASHDGTARVWEAMTGKEVTRMTHDGSVYSVAFSPDGKYVVSGSYITAEVWEAVTGKKVVDTATGGSSVAFSPDGYYVASGSYDGTVRVWIAFSGMELARMTHDDWVYSVGFSPDGKYVVSGSADGTARVWEALNGREIARMTHDDVVYSVAFSPDGKSVASASGDYTVRVWEVPIRPKISGLINYEFPSLDLLNPVQSPDGKLILSLEEDGDSTTIWVSEAVTGKEIAHMKQDGRVNSIMFSRDGRYIVAGSYYGSALVWETATGREVSGVTCGRFGADSVAFSVDGKYAAAGCVEDAIRIWDVFNGKETISVDYPGIPLVVAFSPDGKYIVAGGEDKTAQVWEVSTGKEIARMSHDGSVDSVAFSPDGRYVASGSRDDTVIIWEAATGKEVARKTRNREMEPVTFSSDGKYVIEGRDVLTADIWPWHPADLIADACSRLPRNLTHAEWTQYMGNTLPYQAVCPNLPIEPEITPTP